MSKFKGYAQSTGFKNIQIPDQTKKLRAEGERTTRRMQRNFNAQQENVRAVMEALNDKYRIEEQNREFVFNLESDNRSQIREQIQRNNDVINKNEDIRRQQAQEKFKALASLSDTANKLSTSFLKERSEASKAKGKQLADTIALAGGSHADIQYIRSIDKAHIANDEKFRTIVDRLRANGAPNDIIDQIRNANSSTTYSLQKHLLINAGLDYPQELARFETQPLMLADGTFSEFTLGQARTMGGEFKELVEAQELRNRSEYIAKFQAKDEDPMVARYLYPKMVEAERVNARAKAADRLQRTRREDKLTYDESIRDRYFDGNATAIISFIQNADNHRVARQAVLKAYADLAKEGNLGNGSTASAWDELDRLLAAPISIDGGKTTKAFGELYGKDPEIADIRSAIYARDSVLTKRQEAQRQAVATRKEQEIIRFVHDNYGKGGFDNNYSQELIAEAQIQGIPTDKLKHYLAHNSSDAVARREMDAMLQKELRNYTLDLSDFEGVNDPELLKKYGPEIAALKADRASMPRTDKEVIQGFKDELMIALGESDYQKVKGMSFSRALSRAMQMYNQQLGAPDPNTSPADRQQNAEDFVLGQIAKHAEEDSLFHIIPRTDAKGPAFFAKFQPGADNKEHYIPLEVLDAVKDDPKFVINERFISQSIASDIAGKIKSGKPFVIPQIFHQLATVSNIPAHEIVAKQLELYEIKGVTVNPDVIQNIKSTVDSPELLSILRTPTAANINTVAMVSGNQVPFVRKGEDGYVQSLGRSLNFRSPDVMAAIWALETGNGQFVIGRNALFNVKSLDGTGTSKRVTEYDASGTPYRSVETYQDYDTPAQAAQEFIKTISKYPGVNEATTPREMVMAIAAGGYATDPRYAEKVINVLVGNGVNVDGAFVSYEVAISRDPNYPSQTLKSVYLSGNIGWGSTGPHLDLKQEDNPNTPENERGTYFAYKDPEINEYVFVNDPKLGQVPLTDVPMTGSWESHTNRGSNGYDYGLYDGTPVLIKPPARVVNSFRTSEGDDMMIIELPSGRRFKFHHGRKVND